MPKKQKSGLYRTKIKIGSDSNHQAIYKYLSASTKAELEEKKKEAKEHYITGTKPSKGTTFEDCARTWYKLEKVPRISNATAELYNTALNKHILPILGYRNISSITAMELQEFFDTFSGVSQTKISIIKAAIKGTFHYACANRIISSDPSAYIKAPKATPAKEKYVLTESERSRLSKCCITHKYGYFLALLYYLGCRQGEARGLQWGDFDWDRKIVHIQRDIDNHSKESIGALKTKASNRYIPIPKPLQNILLPLRDTDKAFVCHQVNDKYEPWGKTVTERAWCELCVASDMADEIEKSNYRNSDIRSRYKPRITPHVLRHNYITMCWENGIDCYTTMKLVGHTNYKTTMDIYTHLSNAKLDAAVTAVDEMFK